MGTYSLADVGTLVIGYIYFRVDNVSLTEFSIFSGVRNFLDSQFNLPMMWHIFFFLFIVGPSTVILYLTMPMRTRWVSRDMEI